MENRRRQKWDNNNNRRSQSRRPPRGSWQPTMPSWEKEFCRTVGSLDWETLLQMKKFMHLYDNVIKWNDSAGEEAFSNAKKRFWAEINGLSCDIPLPDPDLYIDEINWDSEIDQEFHDMPVVSNTEEYYHEPVVIFGDSLVQNQEFSTTGWGDDEENLKGPAIYSSVDHFNSWEENWGDSFDSRAQSAWPGYSNYAWQFSNGSGYMPWGGGWNDDSGWSWADTRYFNHVGPDNEEYRGGRETGGWNNGSVDAGRYVSSYRTSRVQGNDRY
ncbi:hypothetical protein BUALT_Bualt16G0116500 [Buddleja alternifolia]|uniref:Uncharacterized protein n=1 Tax=Buddleja alternifolia TaxID=168488 RepID=A0AAV6WLJ8_9LAMI|nr:hypothetical protein BUALT_Bualt16G0116500 [Buddleja alternifolia]